MNLSAQQTSGWSRHRSLLTALLLMLAAGAMYLPAVRYGFVDFDDVRILRDHPELYGQPALADNFRAIFVTGFPREEPLLLRDVTWVVDSKIFGFGNPLGYHLGNILLHGGVVALLFAFLLDATRRYGFALATAAEYLILALHTEPVAWIMGRKDLLATLWMLLALLAQSRRLTTPGGAAAQAGWFVLTLLCLLGGLLSKINVLTFPLVLFLHAVFLPYLRGQRPPAAPLAWRREVLREIFFLLPALVASGVVYVWYRGTLAQMGIFDRGYNAHGLAHLWNLLLVNSMGFWVYLRQVFFPGAPAVLYSWPTQQAVYPAWQIVAALATVAGLGTVGGWLFRRRKDLFFYYAAFFALMITYLNLIYIGIWVADRYLYFSVFAVLAIAVTLGSEALRRPAPAVRLGVLAAALIFAATNLYQKFSYLPAWRDGETLWQYHIAQPRPSPTSFENLAAHYYAAAGVEASPELRVLTFKKMEVVVAAGLEEFWRDRQAPPPPATWYLLFLRSLLEEVRGEPQAALASLLQADALHKNFDAINLNLARLYRRLAAAATDASRRNDSARAARERFANYAALAYRGRPAPLEIQQEIAALEAEFSATFAPATTPAPETPR